MVRFQINDPSIESQWRALILFGKNSATYKFAFANSLLDKAIEQKTNISLSEIARPFARSIAAHLKENDKQGNSASSKFLDACRQYNHGQLSEDELYATTIKYGFVNVVDAFQNLNGHTLPAPFFIRDPKDKNILTITDDFYKLRDSEQFGNLAKEVEARWRLVETAWRIDINPRLLEVKYDSGQGYFFLERNDLRRINITSVRDALNGYQKGKCFYSGIPINLTNGAGSICAVDHFIPHMLATELAGMGVNVNGVWNLVLTDARINGQKSAIVPEVRFLERLYDRNEFYIESKHPLAETIINQTGETPGKRRQFLQQVYALALNRSIVKWKPDIELP